jgi:hypothetical protein
LVGPPTKGHIFFELFVDRWLRLNVLRILEDIDHMIRLPEKLFVFVKLGYQRVLLHFRILYCLLVLLLIDRIVVLRVTREQKSALEVLLCLLGADNIQVLLETIAV